MPNYKSHMVGGFVAFMLALNIIVVQKISLFQAVEWLCFTLLGSLFPDIDIKSKGQKIFYKGLLVLFLLLALKKCVYALILLSFISLLPLVVRHRGVCHELWFVIASPLLCGVLLGSFFPEFLQIFCGTFFFL